MPYSNHIYIYIRIDTALSRLDFGLSAGPADKADGRPEIVGTPEPQHQQTEESNDGLGRGGNFVSFLPF